MEKTFNTKKIIIAVAILLITLVLWILPTKSFGIDGLTVIQQRTMGSRCSDYRRWFHHVLALDLHLQLIGGEPAHASACCRLHRHQR